MNRLELAAQAPLMPDWYRDSYEVKIMSYEEFFEVIRPDLMLNYNYRNDYSNYKQKELNKQIELEWRFYWADKMIKRNDTNDRL